MKLLEPSDGIGIAREESFRAGSQAAWLKHGSACVKKGVTSQLIPAQFNHWVKVDPPLAVAEFGKRGSRDVPQELFQNHEALCSPFEMDSLYNWFCVCVRGCTLLEERHLWTWYPLGVAKSCAVVRRVSVCVCVRLLHRRGLVCAARSARAVRFPFSSVDVSSSFLCDRPSVFLTLPLSNNLDHLPMSLVETPRARTQGGAWESLGMDSCACA